MQIPVYIVCEGDPKSNYVAKLVSLFQDDCFDIFIIDCKEKGSNTGKQYLYSLKHAKENYCESPCIIIRDCMFSNLSDNTMSHLIHKIIDGSSCNSEDTTTNCNDHKYSICYLSRYLDLCDGSVVESGVTTGGSIVTTKYAKGDDAMLYKPDARDIMIYKMEETKKKPADILSYLIKKDINAVAISPPALQYNVQFGSSSNFKKTWECKGKNEPNPQPPCDNTTSYSWLWYIFIFFFLLIIILGFCWWK